MIYGCKQSKLTGTENVYTKKLKVPEEYRFILPEVINQGSKPICTVCAVSAFLNWNINLKDGQSNRDNKIDLLKLFKEANGKDNGAYLKEVLEVLKTKKDINKYALIKDIDTLKTAIIANGPCVGGLQVKDSQITEFWIGSDSEGGHAISFVGWTKEGFILRNSWGKSYGNDGYSIFPYRDFNKLFEIWTLIK